MAEEKPAEAAKKKSKLPMILMAVGLTAAGAGGGFFYNKMQTQHAEVSGEDAEEEPADAAKKGKDKAAKKTDSKGNKKSGSDKDKGAQSVFVPLEVFTVNINEKDRDKYLQLGITMELESSAIGEAMKLKMPIIRSSILLMLSKKSLEELATASGKSKLAEDVAEEVRKPLSGKGDKGVVNVHFSTFLIQ